MKKTLLFIAVCLSLASCGTTKFPAVKQDSKTAIVAHRGFWKCEAAGFSENSIASLKAAQDAGLWGSECDVHLTKDNIVIVNHNKDVKKGVLIAEHTFAELQAYKLPNGESRPSLDAYLDQAAKAPKTKLIIELKIQATPERETLLLEKTIEVMKAHNMYDPSKIVFITFSKHMCDLIAQNHPKFVNQFLSSKEETAYLPGECVKKNINGIDYETKLLKRNPQWVGQAHDLGMSVNVWTVNDAESINYMIGLGVDQITTNEPLLVRELLGNKEYR